MDIEEKSTSAQPQVFQVPKVREEIFDRGFRAWSTVIGGFLATLTSFGYVTAFGVYQDIYTRSGAASASRISWIGSTQLFFLFGMGLPAGKLLDMGYFRHTFLFGSIVLVFSLFMVSLADPEKYYQIYLSQGLGVGIGTGLLYVPAVALQTHHWRARRGLAMGIVTSGTSIGGIIFPIMLNQLFKGSVGFKWGVRVSAFVVLGLLAVANALMHPSTAITHVKRPPPNIKEILTDKPYILSTIAMFFVDWGVFMPYFYLQLFAVVHGLDTNFAFYSLAILNVGSIPGRVIPNLLADRFGPFNVIIPFVAASAVLVFALFGIKTVADVVVFAILYGFVSGAILSLCSPAVATMAKDPSEVGIRFGIAFFASAFGALTGTPINGAFIGPTYHWYKAIIFSGVAIIVGVIGLLVSREMLAKRKGTPFV